jgi:N6-L-threonylcarbamoyladenine synthase
VPSLPGLAYSFSGLKTALLYRVRDLGGLEALSAQVVSDLAASFERSVVTSLLEKVDRALDEWPLPEVVICGGVAANTLLRRRAAEALAGRARLTVPPLALCTDNAAMIAAAAPRSPRDSVVRADPSLGW